MLLENMKLPIMMPAAKTVAPTAGMGFLVSFLLESHDASWGTCSYTVETPTALPVSRSDAACPPLINSPPTMGWSSTSRGREASWDAKRTTERQIAS